MSQLLITKLKNRIKEIIQDSLLDINGYSLNLQTQYIILFEHLRLRYIFLGGDKTALSFGVYSLWRKVVSCNIKAP